MTKDQRPNQFYDLIYPKNGKKYHANPNRVWAYIPESMDKLISEGRIIFPENNSKNPMFKRYKQDLKSEVNPLSTWINNTNEELNENNLQSGLNAEGTRLLQVIFGSTIFNYSKPVSLLRSLLKAGLDKNDIVLDFFAGSGTTGQALMELNKQDEGKRKFILVQLPEATEDKSEAYKAGYKTISDICIERVNRAGEKIKKENKKIDTGFKVLKLTYSHFPENLFSPDPNKSEEENIQEFNKYLEKLNQQVLFDFDFDKLLYEIALKDGFNLNFKTEELKDFKDNKIVRIKDDLKDALVCLDQSISDKTIEVLKTYKDQRFICLKRAVDTTKKWNLQQLFDKNLWVA
jgi:adenine-specific DNA-methyltransferase